MLQTDRIYVGNSTKPEHLLLRYGNRHGLVAGATGNGKTVTLQVLAEGFSDAGVPVFCADIKGDLSGISMPGNQSKAIVDRCNLLGILPDSRAYPTIFWDLFGKEGQRITASVDSVGSILVSRMLELNDIQSDVLAVVFKYAETKKHRLDSLEDLREWLSQCIEDAKEMSLSYGRVSTVTLTSILRALLVLQSQGGDNLFGHTTFRIDDLLHRADDGRGYISVLTADKLIQSPQFYAAFMLWLMTQLFETLPEVGDGEKPKLVFFFDEAHLLFADAPKALLSKVEQVVKLVRSKGVGIYFVTQNPIDIPDGVLSQLSNRFQHALRAYSPREQKAVRVAAETFRANPAFDTEEAITQLETGQALVSCLEDKGVPSMVGKTIICPPNSRIGPVSPEERRAIIDASPVIRAGSRAGILGRALKKSTKKTSNTKEDGKESSFISKVFAALLR